MKIHIYTISKCYNPYVSIDCVDYDREIFRMKKAIDNINETTHKNSIKMSLATHMTLMVAGVVFFIFIVFLYYRMLYVVTKDNIIKNGRVNASESAAEINENMSASFDILRLASYKLDNMIKDGTPNSEILDYLITETDAVRESLIENTTGIYGYYNGEYLDGSGWVPDEGYDATIRPWYTEGKAGGGEFVIVEPYIDLDTGEVMIAITKLLSDGESVAGIDISMGKLQKTVEEHVEEGRSSEEFIINATGTIIVHSNKCLVGADYNDDNSPIDKKIAEKMSLKEASYEYIQYEKHDYMVYILPLDNDWLYVSVIDATEDFASLVMPLFITIIVAILITGLFIFFIIFSDKKSRQAQEMQLKSESAIAASEAKSSFLSSMSHEIRTPINAVIGMNEMILREAKDKNLIYYAENIKTAGATLLGIINDILDFSKIEAGKVEIIEGEYDLSSVINDLVNMIKVRADEKGLELYLNIDREIPKCLYGDEVRIKQIITNILTNAVKYTDKGSITLTMGYVKIPMDPDNVLLSVAVEDTGRGIKDEDIDKLFGEFQRIDEKNSRHIEGTGLGMSITRSLLNLMGSDIIVTSEYGKGSNFSFILNQRVIKWEPLGDYEASYKEHLNNIEVYKQKFTAPDAHVLIVDDTPMNITVFKALIKESKIAIDCARDGDTAINLAAKNKYDIMFIDHMMPGKDGIVTLHEIKSFNDALNFETPAICLTANAIQGAREMYIEAGFNDYLTKPIETSELDRMLMEYIPKEKVHINE